MGLWMPVTHPPVVTWENGTNYFESFGKLMFSSSFTSNILLVYSVSPLFKFFFGYRWTQSHFLRFRKLNLLIIKQHDLGSSHQPSEL